MRARSTLPFDAILFDLDGTIADSYEDIRDALGHAFEAVSIRPPSLSALVDGSPLEEVFLTQVPNGTPGEMSRFVDAYRTAYERGGSRQTSVYPGVRESLDALAAMQPRPRLAIASAKRASTARAVVDALGLSSHFDIVDGSGGRTMAPKPAPDLLLLVAESLGVRPDRTLMVGDTLRDIEAGRRAGMRTAAVTYGLGDPDELAAARPDYLLEDFEEILLVLGARA